MSQYRNMVALFALMLTYLAGSVAPAAAEFFGCHDREGQVLSSRIIVTYPDRGRHATRQRYSHVRYEHRKRYDADRRWLALET